MARARGIKPGFFRNADLAELPYEARLLFIGMWTLADREGRLEDRPKQIKMELFPADNVDCDALIQSIADTGMLARYEHGGKRYLQVCNFKKHQNPHRDERPSTIPAQYSEAVDDTEESCSNDAGTVLAPCEHHANTVGIGLTPDSLTPDSLTNTPLPPKTALTDKTKASTKTQKPPPSTPDGFDLFWQKYPKKVGRPAAIRAWRALRINGELQTILADVESKTESPGWMKGGGQFIPNPATYLNQRRWEDEVSQPENQIFAGAI